MSANNSFFKLVAIVTKPYFAICWFLLAVLSYFFTDKKISIFINSHYNNFIHNTAKDLTVFGHSTEYFIIIPILLLLAFYFKKKNLINRLLFILAVIIIPGLLCVAMKIIFGRARPSMLVHHNMFGFYFWKIHSNMWSFPSGHSATVVGVATALSFFYPKYWVPFIGFSLLVACSRIVLLDHFLSDVMIGTYIGFVGTVLLYKLFTKKYKLLES